MKEEDFILKPVYRAIILLTVNFQDKTKEKGLRLLHYRYALVKKQEIEPYWIHEMETFFGKKLRIYQDMNEITRCIPTRQVLIERLHKLLDYKILTEVKVTYDKKIIDKEERDLEYHIPVYRINQEQYKKLDEIYRKHILKTICINEIEKYPYEKLHELESWTENIEEKIKKILK